MKYAFALAAMAALQPFALAAPAGAEADASGNALSGQGRKASTDVDTSVRATPNEASGNAKGSIAGDNGKLKLQLKLSSQDVAQQVANIGLPEPVAAQVSQQAGSINNEQELAQVAGALAKAAADASSGNNATQASSVIASIDGVIKKGLGESTESNIIIGACVAAAVSGEELDVVVKITRETLEALQKTAEDTPPSSGAVDPYPAKSETSDVSSKARKICTTETCKVLTEYTIELYSKGGGHDVAATFIVAVEALDKFKTTSFKLENEFFKQVVPSLLELDGNADSKAAVDKVGKVVETLQQNNGLSAEAAQGVMDETSQVVESNSQLIASPLNTPCSNAGKEAHRKCTAAGGDIDECHTKAREADQDCQANRIASDMGTRCFEEGKEAHEKCKAAGGDIDECHTKAREADLNCQAIGGR